MSAHVAEPSEGQRGKNMLSTFVEASAFLPKWEARRGSVHITLRSGWGGRMCVYVA